MMAVSQVFRVCVLCVRGTRSVYIDLCWRQVENDSAKAALVTDKDCGLGVGVSHAFSMTFERNNAYFYHFIIVNKQSTSMETGARRREPSKNFQ